MAHLSEDDIEKLFSGAPQYFARSESHFHGAPHPIVAFPFDEELEIRDLTDHVPVENKAWAGLTAWPHLPQHRKAGSLCARQHEERHKAHFHVRCRERPNMLSMQGLEKGTMGYQAALELAVGDSLEEGQCGFTAIGTRSRAVAEARERILSTEGYLRPLSESELLERLRCSGRLYRENDLRKRKLVDSYKDLFHSFMRPYSTVIDKTDHYSLENQIVAILRCLGTPNVWLDFSRVEWRIRLGQVLWGCRDGDELEDSTSIHDAGSADGRQEERRWLLTQILVATELLVRLDAITKGVECGAGAIKPIDAAYFERGATPTVKWSLLLARNWLENVEVVREQATRQEKELHRRSGSWLTSFVGKISSKYYRPPCAHFLSHYSLYPRYLQRQIDGLMHFARKLRWPNVDQLEARIAEKVQKAAKASSSPQTSSHSPARSRHSSSSDTSSTTKSGSVQDENEKAALAPARRRKLAAELHECGWLSKSYVFGLVLPGEGLYHCLMATLVESDCEAMSKLGSLANLSGGFVYSAKSFWSTTCIVGRVLAAGRGAAECMGWVSTDILPRDMKDGWLGIEVNNVEEDMAHLGKKARLWAKKSIERESSILGGADELSVRPADFFIPNENSSYATPPPGVDVKLVSLDLTPASGSVPVYSLRGRAGGSVGEGGKATRLLSYAASVKFSVSVEGTKREEYDYGLTYDINFATAHPCSPPHRVRLLKSVTSSAVERIDVSGSGMLGNGARPVHKMGHPLHKSYSYAVVHISELIRKPMGSVDEILAEHRSEPGQEGGDKGTVLVVDCITNVGSGLQPLQTMDSGTSNMQGPGASRDGKKCFSAAAAAKMHFESRKRQFGSDTEVLVRALCAQRGWNAIISRRKRGCLACAIREAGALGWKVIVRVE